MSKKLELSPRLRAVAGLVPEGARLIDVGTDHAYLPVSLLLDGRISGAIASDLRPGPLDRARRTAEEYGCTRKMSFRLCDGLLGVLPDEGDAVVISGMGGETIVEILSGAAWVKENYLPVILQPMSGQPELRRWLWKNGYAILQEKLVLEGDTFYNILLVSAGETASMSLAQEWAGRQGADGEEPMRGAYLEGLIRKADRALEGMAKARRADLRRQAELTEVRRGLLEMKEEWETWRR